jgi:non-specific serine/threonine protein kinase
MTEVCARARAALDAHGSETRRDARSEGRQKTAPAAVPVFALRRDGADWSVEHAGRSFRLKDVRGLGMLARLVESPGQEIHALDLASSGEAGAAIDAGDSGEVIDARARDAYKRRIAALRVEIDEAERDADAGRAERLRYELDALTDQIAAAVGLGGRERRVGAAAERARITVQRRVREAVKKIADNDPELGRHLDWTVRTGTFCAYEPHGRGTAR